MHPAKALFLSVGNSPQSNRDPVPTVAGSHMIRAIEGILLSITTWGLLWSNRHPALCLHHLCKLPISTTQKPRQPLQHYCYFCHHLAFVSNILTHNVTRAMTDSIATLLPSVSRRSKEIKQEGIFTIEAGLT